MLKDNHGILRRGAAWVSLWLTVVVPALGENRYFVAVGINQYSNAAISELKGAENDAAILAQALVYYSNFKPVEDGSVLLCGARATRQAVRDAFVALGGRAGPDDAVAFVFAGHGSAVGDSGYLWTHDSMLADIPATALAIDELGRTLEALRAGKRLLILDTCRNDPLPSRSGAAALEEAFVRGVKKLGTPDDVGLAEPRFTATLFACGPGERAYERPSRVPVQGYFSYYFVEALRVKTDAGVGSCRVRDVVEYLEQRVGSATRQELNAEQVPWAEITGRYVDQWNLLGGKRQTVPMETRGTVSIRTIPEGAEVYLGGTSVGKVTPVLQLPVAAGPVVVTVKLKGYLTEVKTITVSAWQDTRLDVKLTKAGRSRPPVPMGF